MPSKLAALLALSTLEHAFLPPPFLSSNLFRAKFARVRLTPSVKKRRSDRNLSVRTFLCKSHAVQNIVGDFTHPLFELPVVWPLRKKMTFRRPKKRRFAFRGLWTSSKGAEGSPDSKLSSAHVKPTKYFLNLPHGRRRCARCRSRGPR